MRPPASGAARAPAARATAAAGGDPSSSESEPAGHVSCTRPCLPASDKITKRASSQQRKNIWDGTHETRNRASGQRVGWLEH